MLFAFVLAAVAAALAVGVGFVRRESRSVGGLKRGDRVVGTVLGVLAAIGLSGFLFVLVALVGLNRCSS